MTIEAKIDETNELLRKILTQLEAKAGPLLVGIGGGVGGGSGTVAKASGEGGVGVPTGAITVEKVTFGNSTTELANPVKVPPGASITLTVERGTAEVSTTPLEPTPALEYERDVKPLVLQVSAKKGREACTKMLGEFGLTTAKDAKPEQFADIVVKCKELLA